MTDKQKRAINRGRVKAGLKPIKFKSKGKVLKNVWIKDDSHGHLEKRKKESKYAYVGRRRSKNVECSKCHKKTVGSRDAWFQDFTSQKHICNKCVRKMNKGSGGNW